MTKFIPDGDDKEEGKVVGNLTIKDVTKEVTFDYDFGGVIKNEQVDKIGFSLEGKIDRTEFGVGEASLAVANKVEIELEIEADAK